MRLNSRRDGCSTVWRAIPRLTTLRPTRVAVSIASQLLGVDRVEQYILAEHERINERTARLLQHDGDRLPAGELEHLGDPGVNALGRVLELPMRSLALSIDDIDVVFLAGPVHSDKQARLCGGLIHDPTPPNNSELVDRSVNEQLRMP